VVEDCGGKEEDHMESSEIKIGTRVKVRESLSSEFGGLEGTIMGKWGDPEYLALDVLLGNGLSQLFWHYELDGIEEVA
jgi:hypothetical protein